MVNMEYHKGSFYVYSSIFCREGLPGMRNLQKDKISDCFSKSTWR